MAAKDNWRVSEENVRIVERIQQVLDTENIVADVTNDETTSETTAALVDLVEDDFETVGVAPNYELGITTYHGPDGFRAFWLEWGNTFESLRIDVDQMIDAGDDKVVSLVRQTGRTRTGGVEISEEAAAVWTIRGGRLHRVEFHLDRETALKTAGLDPDSAAD
jgi:ketosteroid isomerase-like protein